LVDAYVCCLPGLMTHTNSGRRHRRSAIVGRGGQHLLTRSCTHDLGGLPEDPKCPADLLRGPGSVAGFRRTSRGGAPRGSPIRAFRAPWHSIEGSFPAR
jgi:hypothetical protein